MKRLPHSPRRRPSPRRPVWLERLEDRLVLSDYSAPPILQYFEGSYQTIENRTADVFNAGYGAVYTPPPGRADSGNQSVGYDVYDRFDLGSPGNPTLYGTETGLKDLVAALHRAGDSSYIDLVWNHDGFSDLGTPGFAAAGGYPGFALTLNPSNNYAGYNDIDGDFHSAFDNSTTGMRLSGLIDIAQEKNYQFVRSPVDPNNATNLPAGTTPAFGRLANVPDPNNARFYPDQSLQPISVFDPTTGEQNIHIYPFNNASPLHGTPVQENALGYLMRYTQWLVQAVGVDGFRIDAAKNMPSWVLNYFDRAVYRSSFRTLLDGTQEPVFGFSEVFDGDKNLLQQYIRKDINPADPGRIGGNRDDLDFPLYFALQSNLSGNGFQNSWFNVVGASQDAQDDGLANNGSQGVAFVSNQDVAAPYLGNVAYAYVLMRPGNAVVYFNAHEFGAGRSFPNDGRGDALGGLYGPTITNLVNIRDTHPSGNYIQRDLEKEILIFERDNSLLFAGSNRLDGGFDSRTVQTNFAPGTPLLELTGNAADPNLDPFDDIPSVVVVNGDGTVDLRVPRNRNANGVETDKGYVIYGLSGPQGALSLTNVDHVIPGGIPTADTNGTTRLADVDVVTGDSFQVRLDTNAVTLPGSHRDHDADGDNALIKIDDGLDVNGNGAVDFTQPGSVVYGFEQFTGVHNPGFTSGDGNGQYAQAIDATRLSDGYHYITVRAFRHRADGGPPAFTDFKQVIYVDRHRPQVAVTSFAPIVAGINENQRVTVRSLDLTANSVHVFLDLPAGLSDMQILGMLGGGSQATQTDRDLFTRDESGLTCGNHVLTVVAFEVSGNYSITRLPGYFKSTIFGAGLGDLNFDGQMNPTDVTLFGQALAAGTSQFNPAADFNGDGVIDNRDLVLLGQRLQTIGADAATEAAYAGLVGLASGGYSTQEGSGVTLSAAAPGSTPALTFGWDVNLDGTADAVGSPAAFTWMQLLGLGVNDSLAYPINVQVGDGTESVTLGTTLTVQNVAPTATFSNGGPFTAGTPVAVGFAAPFDPSPADTAADFHYSIALSPGGLASNYAAAGDGASKSLNLTTAGSYTVYGRIFDKDGGFSEYTTTATVVPGAASRFVLAVAPTSALAGIGFFVTLTAQDDYFNTATGYTGTARLTSSDPLAAAVDVLFGGADQGSKSVSGYVLKTAGTQTLTARDTVLTSVLGSASVNVAADVTDQVSVQRSGLTYNRSTQLFAGTITLTNVGTAALAGGLRLVLTGLTPGVSLTSASVTLDGTTYSLAITFTAAGDPIVTVPKSVLASLAPGQALRINVSYRNPANAFLGFTPKLFSDPLNL